MLFRSLSDDSPFFFSDVDFDGEDEFIINRYKSGSRDSKTDDSKTEQPAESSGSKELSVYTAFPESEVIYYFNKFEQETGIKINYVRLSAGEMLTRVEAEKDNPQATLMFGGSTDNYIAAVDKGLLEAYQSPNLDKTPSTYLDPTGTWNPIYVGCIAFACNSDWFKEKGLEYQIGRAHV